MVSISFIVTAIDKMEEVAALLESINVSATASNNPVEVILIIQGQSRTREEIFRRFSHIALTIKETGRTSLSKARNTAITLASAEWLVMIDDDATIATDFIEQLAMAIHDHVGVQFFCGRILDNRDKTPLMFFFADEIPKSLEKKQYQYFMGSSHIVHRDAFAEIGTYNEKLGAGSENYSGEETELFLRALHFMKEVIYVPKIVLFHPSVLTQEDEKKIKYKKGHGALVRAIFNSYDRNIFKYNFIFLKPMFGYLFYAFFKTKNNANGFRMNIKMFTTLVSGFFNY